MKILFSSSPINPDRFNAVGLRSAATWIYLGSMLLEQPDLGLEPVVDLEDILISDVNRFENLEDYGRVITGFNPDVVGTSVYETNWRQVRGFVRFVKSVKPKVKVLIGGPAPTNIPRAMLRMTEADAAFRGEADLTFRRAVELGMQDLLSIEGVVIREGDRFIEGSKSDVIPIISKDQFSKIRIDFDLFQRSQEENRYQTIDFIFSRSCPYSRCTYCQVCPVKRYRKLDVRTTTERVRKIANLPHVKNLTFGDANFGGTNKGAHQIVDGLIEANLKLNYFCEISVDTLLLPGEIGQREADYSLIRKMHRAGFIGYELGVDHLSLEGLRYYNKLRYTPDEAEKVIRATVEVFGIAYVGLLHVGVAMPQEAVVEHFKNWFRLAADLSEKVHWGPSDSPIAYTGTGEYERILKAFNENPILGWAVKRLNESFETWHDLSEEKEYPYMFEGVISVDPIINQVLTDLMVLSPLLKPCIDSVPKGATQHLFRAMIILKVLNKHADRKICEAIENMEMPAILREYQENARKLLEGLEAWLHSP